MNRWIQYIKAAARVWKNKELRRIILNNPDTLIQSLDKHFSEDDKQVIQKLTQEKQNLVDETQRLADRIKELKQELPETHPKQGYWNNKHPKRNITYQRPIWNGEELENHDIDVRLFITPRDREIQNRIKENNLEIQNPLKLNKDIIPIYREAQQYYDYRYDSKDLGKSEFWKFPYETLAHKRGDCEDHANKIVSFMIAAGVPSWRIRNVCGIINRGTGGHSTVYVLDDSLETWRHLNSTSTDFKPSLTDYPEYGDSDDDIGIDPDRTWFSFNDRYAWSEMATGQIELNGVDIQ